MEKKTIKGVLIDVVAGTSSVVEIEKSLESYYKVLNCDCIDITSRTIGGIDFDIICDDEGLCKSDMVISAVDMHGDPALVGNLLIVKFDGLDDVTSLSDEDAAFVMEHTVMVRSRNHPDPYKIVCDIGY